MAETLERSCLRIEVNVSDQTAIREFMHMEPFFPRQRQDVVTHLSHAFGEPDHPTTPTGCC